jgi:glycosyltransferase involved in cell wall biosynthesis
VTHLPPPGPPLITHVFPSFAVGGAQVRFAALANHFGSAFRHVVVSLDGNLACRERLRSDLDVVFPIVTAPKNAMLANACRFRRMLREWRPDVLVTGNWGAIEFALANILPVARHIHVEDGFGPEERFAQIPRRVTTRRLVLGRSTVVLPSRNLMRVATDVWKLDPRHVRYVPNGVDLPRFARTAALPDDDAPAIGAAGADPPNIGPLDTRPLDTRPLDTRPLGIYPLGIRPPVIGTVAALREEKNLVRLLRAFARVVAIRPARLAIVGDGAERAKLETLAATLGVAGSVTFTGHRDDTPALYAGFDVFALSSDTEQMPLSVIEAMASGLAVASTDVGDVRTMVARENVPFVGPLDDQALAASIAALLADAPRRAAIGRANRAKAGRDFDQAAMFAAWRDVWTGAVPPV